MIVYLLWYGYEDVEGVFSTEEKATEYKSIILALEKYRRADNFSITEYTIDVPPTN